MVVNFLALFFLLSSLNDVAESCPRDKRAQNPGSFVEIPIRGDPRHDRDPERGTGEQQEMRNMFLSRPAGQQQVQVYAYVINGFAEF